MLFQYEVQPSIRDRQAREIHLIVGKSRLEVAVDAAPIWAAKSAQQANKPDPNVLFTYLPA
ncbi:hypothetical protein PTKU46_82990 [Paraburkholderia terrae]|uniref:hypothetical protein n=1 Tax=Paraburkholderia terrae TaxID=311230 RepID=UPI0030E31D1F